MRYAVLDLGAVWHRGAGAAIPVRLWNSLGQADWPTMREVALAARGLNPLSVQLLAADALQLAVGETWGSLAHPVALPDLASNVSVALWCRLVLPTEMPLDVVLGRLRIELQVSWVT